MSESWNLNRGPLAAALATLLAVHGCVTTLPTHDYLITRLRNRGPIPVSIDNPYLASNSLLEKEAQNSTELKGFLSRRGKPFALEVEKSTFAPARVALYYQDREEYFIAEESADSWLISGPFPLSSEKTKQLAPLMQHHNKYQVSSKNMASASLSPKAIPTVASALPGVKKPFSAPKAISAPLSEKESIEKIVRTYGRAGAELSPSGDIVHYVVNEGETLRIIARWYTLDAKNAEQIAAANKISDSNKLLLGDSVVIPASLAKNKKVLTDEAFVLLKMLAQGNK